MLAYTLITRLVNTSQQATNAIERKGVYMKGLELEEYLSNGVENIVKEIMKAALKNPQESLFMLQYASDSKKARNLRKQKEEKGKHIPPFLIASITNQCNLHCKGCYARANKSCHDCTSSSAEDDGMLTAKDWSNIFTLFPVFTNGTMIGEEYIKLLSSNRNLIPVLSIEGHKEATDERRGEGIYEKLCDTMQNLNKRGILFAASVTVNKRNLDEVLSKEFIDDLCVRGCKGVVFVEYVSADKTTKELALDDDSRQTMMKRLDQLRREKQDMLFIAFPGDEKSSGGCLAAGRGFFHINARGGAEPCPFSPYSDTNLKNVSLEEALMSPLFQKLRDNGNLEKEHIGGCVLFEQEELVRKLI